MSRIPRWKRLSDIAIASLAIVATAPLMLVISIAIRVSMGSPVFFRQIRTGLGGRCFLFVKFRTMNGEPAEGLSDRGDATRLTRLGSFLRATSLDELPTLLHVLSGEMSMVGPRPLLPEYLPLYTPEQARRHEVPPGLTGWAQIHGRNAITWEEKFERDVWYVDHRSALLDLRILVTTIGKVFVREGVSAEGSVTTEAFRGSLDHPATKGIRR